jgi:parallel beta-helix repeat protein
MTLFSSTQTFTNRSNFTIRDISVHNVSGEGLSLKGCSHVLIDQCEVVKTSGVGIRLENCTDVVIRNCLFTQNKSGVYAINSKHIGIEQCTCTNVQGPKPRGQFVQFNTVNGENCFIRRNTVYNNVHPDIEDVISLYRSAGTRDSWITVEDNYIYNGGSSKSGGGIMLGDNAGSFQIARNNILINPGQYGIAIAYHTGESITIEGNQVYAKKTSYNNVGIYTWKQKGPDGPAPKDALVTKNRVHYIRANGSPNPFWGGDGGVAKILIL